MSKDMPATERATFYAVAETARLRRGDAATIYPAIQVHTCVSVHCDQCGDALGSPAFEAHYPTENAALDAAAAGGWRVGSDRRLLCSACAPVLTCDVEGHKFSTWRHPVTAAGHPGPSEHRHCWRCCRHESRPASQDRRHGGEPR